VTLGSNRAWKTRVWDLGSKEELFTERLFRLRTGQEDKRLYGLAAANFHDDVRFAFAGQYGKVMVSDFSNTLAGKHDFVEWYLPFRHGGGDAYTRWLDAGCENGTELLVAGTQHGELVLWDFESGDVLAKKSQAHVGAINSVVMRERSTETRLLSAGDNGFLRIWNTSLEELAEIEISEVIRAAIWLDDTSIIAGTARGVLAVGFPAGRLFEECAS
jgi:WD40 repeat protein